MDNNILFLPDMLCGQEYSVTNRLNSLRKIVKALEKVESTENYDIYDKQEFDTVIKKLITLSTKPNWVSVFFDGTKYYIIEDGNGQENLMDITEETFGDLMLYGYLEENSYQGNKNYEVYDFIPR